MELQHGKYVLSDGDELIQPYEYRGCAHQVTSGPLTLNHYMLRSWEEYRRKRVRARSRPELQECYTARYFDDREPLAS